MDLSHTELKSGPAAVGTASTGLTGSLLLIARTVWLALVIPSMRLFAAGLPLYYTHIQRACVDPVTCNIAGALMTKGLQELPAFGLSVRDYAALLTIFFTIIAAIWSGIGFLIFWRWSDEWFALLSAFFLVMFNIAYPGFPISALALAYLTLNGPITFMEALGHASLATFPKGGLVPPLMGLFLLLFILSTVIPPNSPFSSSNWSWWVSVLLNVSVFGALIVSRIDRYLRASTRVERRQAKWVVFGMLVLLAGTSVLPAIFNFFFPTYFSQPYIPSSVFIGLLNYPLMLLALPVTVGIVALRSRSYDIDVLINRTLVYGMLTLLLALVYFGLVIGLDRFYERS